VAEILLKWLDATNGNAVKDQRGCYKRGDPVVVMPDGHPWGREELKPPAQGGKFVVVKVPGLDPVLVKERLEAPERSDLLFDNTGDFLVTRRRRVGLDLSAFASNTLQAMERDGEITLTLTAARDRLLDKVTRERAW
jgi:hypothetical protein